MFGRVKVSEATDDETFYDNDFEISLKAFFRKS